MTHSKIEWKNVQKCQKKLKNKVPSKNQEPFQNLRNTKPRPSQGHQEHSDGSKCVFIHLVYSQSGESDLQKPHPTRPYNLKNCLRNHNFIQKRRRVLRTNPPHEVRGAEPQVLSLLWVLINLVRSTLLLRSSWAGLRPILTIQRCRVFISRLSLRKILNFHRPQNLRQLFQECIHRHCALESAS